MIEKIIARTLGIDQDAVKDNAHFINDLGADSLNIVELVMEIEEEYDMEIPDEDAENILSVKQAINYINNHS